MDIETVLFPENIIGDKKAMKRGLGNVVSGERNTYLKLKMKDQGHE